jgi:hypothetical protein
MRATSALLLFAVLAAAAYIHTGGKKVKEMVAEATHASSNRRFRRAWFLLQPLHKTAKVSSAAFLTLRTEKTFSQVFSAHFLVLGVAAACPVFGHRILRATLAATRAAGVHTVPLSQRSLELATASMLWQQAACCAQAPFWTRKPE